MVRRPDAEFEDFYQAHRADVFRTAYLMTADREEARDLTQETFMRAFQHWREVSRHERPGAWLQTVVGRLAISWRRRQAVRLKQVAAWGDAAPDPVVAALIRHGTVATVGTFDGGLAVSGLTSFGRLLLEYVSEGL